MKITNTNGGSVSGLNQSPEVTQPGQAGRAGSGGTGSGVDHVQLSSLGAQLGVSGGGSPEGAARLAHLTATVSSRRYPINASAVSASIVQEHTKSGI
jgi:hypothetical protein